jgi:XTP/dITP diphosphohydrolase
MKKILIATRNQGKYNEFKEFLKELSFQVVSLKDLNIGQDVKEDGKTYQENSQKKALFYSKLTNLPTIADDGGIEIDCLNGAPGIRSRRYFGINGQDATDDQIISEMKKIVHQMSDDKRGAKFVANVTFALPSGKIWSIPGQVEGIIAEKPLIKLMKGYPYRSFFFIPQINKYYHENQLSKQEQKRYNHRYKAVSKLKPVIKKELGF